MKSHTQVSCTLVVNDHLARQTYQRNSYETFLLDSGNPDYSFELDFLVFDLCDKHDYLTVYARRMAKNYHNSKKIGDLGYIREIFTTFFMFVYFL